jgi:hypothetical protein
MKLDIEVQKRETQTIITEYGIQYKHLLAQAKIEAKQHRIGEAHRCAKQMVTIKKAQFRVQKQLASMNNTQQQLRAMKLDKQSRDTMNKLTDIMKSMNSKSDVKRLQKDAQAHVKANQTNKLAQELLEDVMDQVDEENADDESESQTDAIMKQILEEIGLATADAMPAPPSHTPTFSNNFTIHDRVNLDDVHLGINGVKKQ